MNNILDINDENCTSCQMCAAICPVNAINIIMNEEGFYRPEVNKTCVSCGQCKRICYKFNFKNINTQVGEDWIKSYSAQSRDGDILSVTTSGGVADVLATTLFNEGFSVVGVVYDYNNNTAKHLFAQSKDDIALFRGSKYIQSYTLTAFKNIVEKSENLKYKFAVFGTPCQIYTISQFIESKNLERSRFLLIDIFCHGCPSILLWNKVVDYCKRKLKVEHFIYVNFRSKLKKWHNFCLEVHGQNKSICMYVYDLFYGLFFSNNILNLSCTNCKLRSTLQYTDIRLGDFWGSKFDFDLKGVSAVAVGSEYGLSILNKYQDKLILKECLFEDITKYQSYGKIYRLNLKERQHLFILLKSTMTYEKIFDVIQQDLRVTVKLMLIIRKIILNINPRLQAICRSFYHKLRY